MAKSTDVQCESVELYYLPVETRVPLKFGSETLTHVHVLRVKMQVRDRNGRRAVGWGETPLSVQWAWPSSAPYEERHQRMQDFCHQVAETWATWDGTGHPMEVGHDFIQGPLRSLWADANQADPEKEPMPWLAALISASAFDLALHDAYGCLHGVPTYETYGPEYMNTDLGHYLEPAPGTDVSFTGLYPRDFFAASPPRRLPAWHLVGGKDLLDDAERTGDEPDDGYPVTLPDWIRADGLTCLKVKLRGNDPSWDYDRMVRVGEIAIAHDALWLTADFNCTVTDPAYVNEILDRLMREHPRIYQMILYVEQPFPYDLEAHRIDVHSVSARKPLFMDESAHDWELVRIGRELGWTGVALKTCKTQTGALLTLCWAKAHGMTLMVQDLTNPMLAQIPHVLLAAYAETIMGVETNAMQFYPEASRCEAVVHPGLYRRRGGEVDWSTVSGPGFGYRIHEIDRTLPSPVVVCGASPG